MTDYTPKFKVGDNVRRRLGTLGGGTGRVGKCIALYQPKNKSYWMARVQFPATPVRLETTEDFIADTYEPIKEIQ